MLYILYNLLLKPWEFNKPEWIKEEVWGFGVFVVFFFCTVQRRFGLAGKKWGKKWKQFQVSYFHCSLPSVAGGAGREERLLFFFGFAFPLLKQLGSVHVVGLRARSELQAPKLTPQ